MKLSNHFTLEELTRSDTAIRLSIDQKPSPVVCNNLLSTAQQLEIVRSLLGKAIIVSSGYRSPELNKIIGGAPNSAHTSGFAVDFTCPDFGDPTKIVKFLSESPLVTFDQLICEGAWVHISFAPAMRREVLSAHFNGGPATYTRGVA